MKFVIAPDSFKESMTAKEACDAIEDGLKMSFPTATFTKVPMADGGEGTTRSLVDATNGEMFSEVVSDPLGNPVNASFGVLGDRKTAVIEMASASGIGLVPKEKRNPLYTTTFGTGELIKKALEKNIDTIIIGIGGSATNDGGAGMIQALGGKLLDKHGNQIGFGGGALRQLAKIDISGLDKRLQNVKIIVACDVDNPLTGPTGASYIFGPQKGATPEMVEELDNNLKHFAKCIRESLGKDVENIPGAGAAGGLGAGLLAFLPCELKRGIDIVIEYSNLREKMKDADYVITGEGSIDAQTRFGKTPYGVAKVAKEFDVPVIAVAGNIGRDVDVLYEYGFDAFFSILQGVETLDKALANGKENLIRTCNAIGRLLRVNKK
ncbi:MULTISPECIES: glycerate kinase [Clostridium]|uniref:Glycerate 2-kinase n=2 Tax=Clostridium TaxID=1485 RepID=A0A151ANV3_9CLOT|nr:MULTISPECIES: glycerate kinase [Clostridium]KYH29311.1 glycerate 2-kinase [Clostridium colicanis DSM 13634]MBE6043320.1 glycerate kinase [Clostridium thermopalmarium]PRR70975.1 Glycerate 2-kinase [Clostridium thermopalmarium DSM 5974]PVZ28897.1 glycerate kinase [Clostridium thermopalmarium DSM 5974]